MYRNAREIIGKIWDKIFLQNPVDSLIPRQDHGEYIFFQQILYFDEQFSKLPQWLEVHLLPNSDVDYRRSEF